MKSMNLLRASVCAIVVVGMMAASTAQAQFNADNNAGTVTGAGVTSNWVDTTGIDTVNSGFGYVVGDTNNLDSLNIFAGSVLSNGFGIIGGASGITTNYLLNYMITNAVAQTTNAVVTTNAVLVVNRASNPDGSANTANGNSALISGAGSLWTNQFNLTVGNFGNTNSMIIEKGGSVMNNLGIIGNGFSPAATNIYSSISTSVTNIPATTLLNKVVVTDSGSTWINAGTLTVGNNGFRSSLIVSNGATVLNNVGVVGSAIYSSNNSVEVQGSGSTWNNGSGSLTIGNSGQKNSMVVSNGGSVMSVGGVIGSAGSSSNNSVLVQGSGSSWSADAGTLTVGSGSRLNSMTISNSATVSDAFGVVGASAGADSNSVLVIGSGSTWNNSGSVTVGGSGATNSLTIANGGKVVDNSAIVGNNSTRNSVSVTGAGSTWNNVGTLTVGAGGSSNTLIIAAGGAVVDSLGQIGTSGTLNAALVTGAGSVWSNTSAMYIGFSKNNSLTIANGGAVSNGGLGFIGYDPGAGGGGTGSNTVIVTGAGSVLDNSAGILRVGYVGQTNALIVNSGGKVLSANLYVGQLGSNNVVSVTGANSTLKDAGFLNMGQIFGNFNTMVVSNGGTVSVGGTTSLGSGSATKSNNLIVGAAGASFTGQGDMYVGESGSSNTLVINGGGTVAAPNVYVGLNAGSAGNTVTVNNGGTLTAQNAGTGGVEVRRGNLTMNVGSTMNVDQFTATNGAFSVVAFNGGTLNTAATTINNGQRFNAGNGLSLAVLNLVGNGTHSFANGILINTNASLTGNGTIVGDLTSAGRIAPDNGPGLITVNGNLTLQLPSVLDMQIGGTNQVTDYDLINVSGSVTLNGMLKVSFINGYVPPDSNVGFVILQGTSPLGGTFTNIVAGNEVFVDAIHYFNIDYLNNSVRLYSYSATPEPSTCLLVVIGLVGVVATRRARGRKS